MLLCIRTNLIDSVNNIYLTVDSLIEINYIINGLNNIVLRKVRFMVYEFEKYIWKQN